MTHKRSIVFQILSLTMFVGATAQAQQLNALGSIVSGDESTVRILNQNKIAEKPSEPTIIFRVGPAETYRDGLTTHKSTLGDCDSACAPNMSLTPPRPNDLSTKTFIGQPVMPHQ